MENNENLEACYKYVYPCDQCGREYGNDKKENGKHICPICEDKFKK